MSKKKAKRGDVVPLPSVNTPLKYTIYPDEKKSKFHYNRIMSIKKKIEKT